MRSAPREYGPMQRDRALLCARSRARRTKAWTAVIEIGSGPCAPWVVIRKARPPEGLGPDARPVFFFGPHGEARRAAGWEV